MKIVDRLAMEKDYIINEYLGGKSTTKLGKEFNCNSGSIYLFLQKNNVSIKSGGITPSPEDEQKVVALYKSGIGSYLIAKQTGISKPTVLRILKRNGITTKATTFDPNNLLKDKADIVTKLHNEGKTQIEISEIVGHPAASICTLIKKLGLAPRDYKYHVDEHFFDKIDTPDKAYFLGWMYSDGNVMEKGLIRIQIQATDDEILYKLKEMIKYEGPLHAVPARNTSKPQTCFSITRKYMADKLIELGCVPNKSLILKFPTEEQVPSNLLSHFMRGMFDGDGGISVREGRKSGTISITSTDLFNNKLQELLSNMGIKSQIYYRYDDTSSCSLMITYKEGCITFRDWMYADSTICMERKKTKCYQIG